MIYEQVIVKTVSISRQRQVCMFQFNLPRQTEEIIGVETGLRWITGVPVPPRVELLPWKLPITIQRNTYIGDLKLQSPDQANIFFAKDLVLNNNTPFADFTSQFLVPKVYTSELKSEEDHILIGGKATTIFGCYKDYLADLVSTPYAYQLSVYVWIRLKDNKTLKP